MGYFLFFIIVVVLVGLAIRSHKKDRMLKSTSPSALNFHLKEKVECSSSIDGYMKEREERNRNWAPSRTASSSLSYSASPSMAPEEDEKFSREELKELLISFIKKC